MIPNKENVKALRGYKQKFLSKWDGISQRMGIIILQKLALPYHRGKGKCFQQLLLGATKP